MRGIVTAAERLAELFADREPAEVALMFRKAAEIADRRRPMQVRSTTIRTTAARRLDALFG